MDFISTIALLFIVTFIIVLLFWIPKLIFTRTSRALSLIRAVVRRRRLVKEKRELVKCEGQITRALLRLDPVFSYRLIPTIDFCELEDRLNEVRARLAQINNQLNV